MPFKYEPDQILVSNWPGRPDFYRVDKRSACFVTFTKLEAQSTLIDDSQASLYNWQYEDVPTSDTYGDPPRRWKVTVKENGDEEVSGLYLWDGEPVRYWVAND